MSTELAHPNPHGLPPAPCKGQPVSAAMFDRLLTAAEEHGWPGVYTVFAEGETVMESGQRRRDARRRTLDQWKQRRPDLCALLDDAVQRRRDRLLSSLEDEVEQIALGPGDVTTDLRADGSVARTRVDKRNKLYAILQLLKAHDRDTYGDHRRVDVAGTIDHNHAHQLTGGHLVQPEHVLLLEVHEQQELFRLLDRLETLKREPTRELIDGTARESEPEKRLPSPQGEVRAGDGGGAP